MLGRYNHNDNRLEGDLRLTQNSKLISFSVFIFILNQICLQMYPCRLWPFCRPNFKNARNFITWSLDPYVLNKIIAFNLKLIRFYELIWLCL